MNRVITKANDVVNEAIETYLARIRPLDVVRSIVVVNVSGEVFIWNVLLREFPGEIDSPGYDHLGDTGADLIEAISPYADAFVSNINPCDMLTLVRMYVNDGFRPTVMSVND
jgi:hypothetical protein